MTWHFQTKKIRLKKSNRERGTIDVGDIIVSANGNELTHCGSLLQLATEGQLRLRIQNQVRPIANDFVRLVDITEEWQQLYHLQVARILEDIGGMNPYKLQGMEDIGGMNPYKLQVMVRGHRAPGRARRSQRTRLAVAYPVVIVIWVGALGMFQKYL